MSTAACVVLAEWGVPSSGCCGEPAAGVMVSACVHEHCQEQPVCAADAAEIQRVDPEDFICRRCLKSAEPHECRVSVTFRWHGGDQP